MIELFIQVITALLLLSIVMAAIRALKGPTIPDRILAIDAMSYTSCAITAILSIYYESRFLIVASFSLALWAYVGTLYLAKYLEGREAGD